MNRTITSGALGLLVGVLLALLGHFFALADFPSSYSGFGDDVYAIITDVAIGAFLGLTGGVFTELFCHQSKRRAFCFGVFSLLLSMPALAWNMRELPGHTQVDGSTLSFDALTNQIWYTQLWYMPVAGLVLGCLGWRLWTGKIGLAVAFISIASSFLPAIVR